MGRTEPMYTYVALRIVQGYPNFVYLSVVDTTVFGGNVQVNIRNGAVRHHYCADLICLLLT